MAERNELKTQLEISKRLNYILKEEFDAILNLCGEVQKMMYSLIRKYSNPKDL